MNLDAVLDEGVGHLSPVHIVCVIPVALSAGQPTLPPIQCPYPPQCTVKALEGVIATLPSTLVGGGGQEDLRELGPRLLRLLLLVPDPGSAAACYTAGVVAYPLACPRIVPTEEVRQDVPPFSTILTLPPPRMAAMLSSAPCMRSFRADPIV